MTLALVVIFVLAYSAIALEHPLSINKSASALLAAGLLWTLYALSVTEPDRVNLELQHSLVDTAQIVFFLMGAMTIVEVIDAHEGFEVITARIKPARLSTLFYVVGVLTFFLSAVLDNLTTTIVMVSLVKKLPLRDNDRMLIVGNIIIAANAGGAWSPIGDVTTTMLWIGGQITSTVIMKTTLIASLINMLLPLAVSAFLLGNRRIEKSTTFAGELKQTRSDYERNLMFCLGLGTLLAVPAFKAITHLPPFMGILFGLGILWLAGDLVHRSKADEEKYPLTLVHALSRIDLSSILFFVGIILAVAVLEHAQILHQLSSWLEQVVPRKDLLVMIIGLVSAVMDNVPLVAAAMSMYDLSQFPTDHFFWTFLAYCAGTGGSILVIGSAAGVAAMGLENISFFWYLRKISGLALLGYIAGAAAFLVQHAVLK